MNSTYGNPWQQALTDYQSGIKNRFITVKSNISVDEDIPVSYYFRDWEDMPEVERLALQSCKGHVLDLGCGTGRHAIWLKNNGFEVTGLDDTEICGELLVAHQIPFLHGDAFAMILPKVDTILMMMNGIGVVGTFGRLHESLSHISKALKDGGQILLDSTNLVMASGFESTNESAVVEAHYFMEYEGTKGEVFPWLYIDATTLAAVGMDVGLKSEVLLQEKDGPYLLRMFR